MARPGRVQFAALPLVILVLTGTLGCATAPRSDWVPWLDEAQIDLHVMRLAHGTAEERRASAWTLGDARASRRDLHEALRTVLDDAVTDDELRAGALWALYRADDPGRGEWQAPGAPSPSGVSAYDTPPKLVRKTMPVYPTDAFQHKVQGTVVASILIDAGGRIARLHLTHSIPSLDRAAVRCLAAWRFSPAVKEGRPVTTAASAPINFRIF